MGSLTCPGIFQAQGTSIYVSRKTRKPGMELLSMNTWWPNRGLNLHIGIRGVALLPNEPPDEVHYGLFRAYHSVSINAYTGTEGAPFRHAWWINLHRCVREINLTLYNVWNYVPMPRLRLNQVSKKGFRCSGKGLPNFHHGPPCHEIKQINILSFRWMDVKAIVGYKWYPDSSRRHQQLGFSLEVWIVLF